MRWLALFLVVMFYLAATSAVWQFRNPKANAMTYWTHLGSALRFQKVAAFQEVP